MVVPREIPEVVSVPAPAVLKPEAVPVWDAVIADLGGRGRVRQSDLPQVFAYVEAVWIHLAASQAIHEGGLLIRSNGRPVAHPLLKVQKEAAATMLRYADQLGLTPSARIRMAVEEITGMSILAGLNASLDAAVAAG